MSEIKAKAGICQQCGGYTTITCTYIDQEGEAHPSHCPHGHEYLEPEPVSAGGIDWNKVDGIIKHHYMPAIQAQMMYNNQQWAKWTGDDWTTQKPKGIAHKATTKDEAYQLVHDPKCHQPMFKSTAQSSTTPLSIELLEKAVEKIGKQIENKPAKVSQKLKDADWWKEGEY